MKVLFFFKSGDLLLLKSGEFKVANYSMYYDYKISYSVRCGAVTINRRAIAHTIPLIGMSVRL